MKRALPFILLVALVAGCAPDESIPGVRSSASSSMDGAHYVPFSGAPDEVTHTAPIDSTYAPNGWSTAPVPLFHPYGFAIGSRNGRIFVFNDRDSLFTTIDLGSGEVVDQLLADESAIYAVTVAGNVFAYAPQGKALWHSEVGGMLTGPAVIAANELVLPRGEEIIALNSRTGARNWKYGSTMHAVSLAVGPSEIVAGLSNGAPGRTDSIVVFDLRGVPHSRIALTGYRITSNIALAGQDKNLLAVGVLGDVTDQRRQASTLCYSGYKTTSPELVWKHTLPYIVMNVGANANSVVASGFRTLESDRVSGADAFSIVDTTTMWSRRFSEPLGSPVAVSNGNIYFTMSFTSEAIVAARGLFYTLSSGTGKTVSERPIAGANAFVPGMPIPDEQGRLLVADRDKLIVYILDRSTLKRVF